MIVPVKCFGHVEVWLGELLKQVLDTVKGVLARIAVSLAEHDFDFVAEIDHCCAQAGLMGLQLLWTRDSEYALSKSKKIKKIMVNTNKKFIDLLNSLVDKTTQDLTKLQRISVETMVTIHVHQRDIFDDLVNLKITNASNFEWQKQSRFYFEEENEKTHVRITDILFEYQNEYLGVKERLAITPLTDRCYITLAQAIGMCMGGAPGT
jgi:dynein heavy chain